MSILNAAWFHEEEAAFAKLESLLWPNGPVCPHCRATDRIYALNGVRSKPSKKNPEGVVRHGLKKCGHCRKQFTVRVGTVFESSHIPLHKWFQAVHLMCTSKKGISSHQLHRTLEVTYEAAWFMSHRIREAMRSGALASPMGGPGSSGIVESDETFIGSKKGVPKAKGGYVHKQTVLSLVERGGEVRSFVIDRANAENVAEVATANIDKEAHLMTDDAGLYRAKRFPKFGQHSFTNHKAGEYVRGEVHTNTVENYFSVFKRGMKGVYQHCSEKHLHRYLAEFDFRYNNRSALGIEDVERTAKAMAGITGKRLTYRSSDSGTERTAADS